MKKYGLVVAVEDSALHRRFGEGYALNDGRGTVLYQTAKCQLYALHSGAGEVFAASATQFLIDRYEVDGILNYGVVGACVYSLDPGSTVAVSGVVHYDYDLSGVDGVSRGRYLEYPTVVLPVRGALTEQAKLHKALCASGDKFLDDPSDKLRLHVEYGAEICDMEAAGILLTCDLNRVPCLMVKTVSDGVDGGAEEYWREKDGTAASCMDAIIAIIDGL